MLSYSHERTFSCLQEAVERSGIKAGQISALAISNQRATVICADHRGEAIGDAVSWQDIAPLMAQSGGVVVS